MTVAASKCVNWRFGRGLSIGCKLEWSVPTEWSHLARDEKISRITATLRKEMDDPTLDCKVIRCLLDLLAKQTGTGWCHRFITTNWDYLLQREILALPMMVQPPWLANSHVFHLNGTVEDLPDNSNRSPFLLQEDSATQRTATPEAAIVYNQIIWDQTFVLVGMSFECETDRFLLHALGQVEDDLPIGESSWVVVNPDPIVLGHSCQRLQEALPRALVKPVRATLSEWLENGPEELRHWGILAC